MSYLELTDHQFNPHGFWEYPLETTSIPLARDLALFDQNGYDLTDLEQRYAQANRTQALAHREHRLAVKAPWFTQDEWVEGAVLNHSLLFERKGYAGAALQQLEHWANANPLIYKIIRIRPKWGLELSIDYADRDGNVFEVLHWEYDGFDYAEVESRKQELEPRFAAMDWDDAAARILKQKDHWHHLDFFAQSDWKCKVVQAHTPPQLWCSSISFDKAISGRLCPAATFSSVMASWPFSSKLNLTVYICFVSTGRKSNGKIKTGLTCLGKVDGYFTC